MFSHQEINAIFVSLRSLREKLSPLVKQQIFPQCISANLALLLFFYFFP